QRSLAGAFSKIDCGFRNPSLLLGLAIWFSKTEPLVSTATSCYLAAAFYFFPASAGRLFYFIFASAVNHPISAFFSAASRNLQRRPVASAVSFGRARLLSLRRIPCQPLLR
ncbi:hypothetical protein, partial [Myxococcus eversor]|uniref:hypothetical protein n=1 Tax=Myxococcus eversor TaxID=2709661 RepID=UPI001967BCE3